MVTQDTQRPITKTICQLGFRCGQQSSQPATTSVGFDRKATRNPQLHIVPYVTCNVKKKRPSIMITTCFDGLSDDICRKTGQPKTA